ncbi:MAG: SDR family oxidoreductase [Myxococcales bacterium]|nr:SDR family oxidoreductase [Myxococcales bacterium]
MQPSIFRPGLFDGTTTFITGGGTGIGLAIARELRMLGGSVVLGSRKTEHLETGRAALLKIDAPGKVEIHPCNIRDEASMSDAVDFALKQCGRIDFLVNNGGGQFPAPALSMSWKGWHAVIETNLTGTFFMSKIVAERAMGPGGGGAIVSIIAQMWNGFPMMVHTGAARAGVDNLTKTLALEWSPLGIRVNAVAPGAITSSGLETYPDAFKAEMRDTPRHIVAGRRGTVRGVAAATLYLLSPAAGFVTGTTLRIDGGETLFGNATGGRLKEMMTPKIPPEYD